MNMPAIKTEAATAIAAPTAAVAAPVVTMTPKRPPRAEKYVKMAKDTAVRVVPPLIVLALLLLFWELVCRRAGSTLPPPSRVFKDTKELIFDPFFDRGGEVARRAGVGHPGVVVARQGNLLRRQGIRSGKSGRLPQVAVHQAR